jgi:hypothetical protein
MALGHVASVKTEPDVRGVVAYAWCLCGWRGPNHPGGELRQTLGIYPTVEEARRRATDDMMEHLRKVDPNETSPAPPASDPAA